MEIINKEKTINEKKMKRDKFFKEMELMFKYKSKLSKMMNNNDALKNYKETYFYLFEKIESGRLPILKNYLGDNVLAQNIYKNKYFLKDIDGNFLEENAEDVYMRLAAYVACIESTTAKREEYAEKFYLDLFEGHYLPGGRVLAGAGDLFRLKTLANCFVSTIDDDNLESIYKTAYEAARTYSYGGGIGIDISQLRPKDSKVHNAADNSTGAVSFMELYSLTTGLIGQSGRRGALMLTIDVKHPDVIDFIKVKQDKNWATTQILERLNSSKLFNEEQMRIAEKNIIENTQVRFANISIKVSDEFMSAVEEQNQYGKDMILVYKKKQKGGKVIGRSSDDINYSYGISEKEIKDYSLLEKFKNLEELNSYLNSKSIAQISKEQLNDINNRDFYGNFVIESEKLDFDLAIKYSGDFLTYYHSKSVGEIKQLHKARDIWNAFVEGNYQTAEPGLIFWSEMTKYSPSNYAGRPIACTNPCFSADNYVQTLEGPCQIGDIINKKISIIVDNKIIPTEGFFSTGVKEVYELISKEGLKIKLTNNHPLKLVNQKDKTKWVEVKDLKIGDKLKLQFHDGLSWSGKGSKDEGFLLGMLVGDGTFSENIARLSVWNDEKLKTIILKKIKPFMKSINFKGWDDSYQKGKWNIKSTHLSHLAQEYEIIPKIKEISKVIECASSQFQIGFLCGIFSADGCAQYNESKGHRYIRLNQSDLKRLEAVQRMLLRFGIFSKIYHRRDASTKIFPNKPDKEYKTKDNYDLSITKESLIKFANLIGIEGYKKENLQKVVESFGSRGAYKENFEVEISEIKLIGKEEVFDIQVPGENRVDVNGFDAHNCGEVPLEDGGSCNLGSINLSRMVKNGFSENAEINWDLIAESSGNLVRFLDNVVWWNETLNALDKQRAAANLTRRLGIGVMGIADLFLQMGLEYDSPQALDLLEKILNHIAQATYKKSALLAKEKGAAPTYNDKEYLENPFLKEVIEPEIQDLIKKNGIRNIAILSIAPTGTISNAICGFRTADKNYIGVSGGMEPIFALYYTRRSEQMNQGAVYNIFHNTVQAYIDVKGLTEKAKGCDEAGLREILPSYFFKTAHYIKPDMRVKIQGIAQKYIDHSISSTVNLAEDIEPETISDIYINAWKNRLKGITVYRDGSRYPILSVPGEETAFQRFKDKKFKIKDGDKEKVVAGNDVLITQTGKLTTIYHGKKEGLFN